MWERVVLSIKKKAPRFEFSEEEIERKRSKSQFSKKGHFFLILSMFSIFLYSFRSVC